MAGYKYWEAPKKAREIRKRILGLYFENRNRRPGKIVELLKRRYGIKVDRTTVWRVLYGNGLNCSQMGRPRGSRDQKKRGQKRKVNYHKSQCKGPRRTKAEVKAHRRRRRNRLLREQLRIGELFTKFGGLLLYAPLIVESHLPELLAAVKQDLGKALQLLNHLMSDAGCLSDMNEEGDVGLPLSSGLDDLKDASELHRYLEGINGEMLSLMQEAFGKRMHQLGAFKGQGVNVDGHFIPYYGELDIPKGHHGTKKRMEKGFYLWVVCDHHSSNLIYFQVTLCDVRETKVLTELLTGAEKIVGENTIEFYCVDKGFYEIGIISGLGADQQAFIPAKNTPNVIKAMQAIPEEQFRPYAKKQQIAETTVKISGKTIRLIVLDVTNKQGQTRRFGFLTSDPNLSTAKVVKRYSRRWRVENWLKAGKLDLNLDGLPGLIVIYQDGQIVPERLPDKLAAFIFFKGVSSHLVAWLNRLSGQSFRLKKWRQAFFCHNALWKIKKGKLVVSFLYPLRQQHLFQKLWLSIQQLGFSINIPWLDNLAIQFVFQPF